MSGYRGPDNQAKNTWRDDLAVAVGQRIKEMRQAGGLSCVDMAKAIEDATGVAVGANTLRNYELAQTPFPLWVVVAIAEVLDCTMDELCPVMEVTS